MEQITISKEYNVQYTEYLGEYRESEEADSAWFIATIRETPFEKAIERIEWDLGEQPEVSDAELEIIEYKLWKEVYKQLI